ncbi:predicted protein [Naegleria gruberi]|uniref:Predicted protein n=1 Tax=Naegleria gruberi TaxID=5762 RepID=D2VDM0_NAEGR|nr:uncharacterized protein NAEGRDRAFT_48691 [Naegleria gruberi]EFC44921.1 predicted protein [Naegleria gruberi]|eukprot:XP_002677665.1 predicted protein [Naegleria gruberi strain NEG-M]
MSYSSEEDYQEEEPFSSSSPSSPSSSSSGDEEEESTDDRYVRAEGNNPKRKNLNVTSNSSSSNMNFIQSNFNDHHYIYPDSDLNYGFFLNTTANRRSSSSISGGDKKNGAAAFTFTASGQPFGISGGGLGGGDQTLISSSNSNSFSSSNSTPCGGFKFDDTSKVLFSQQKPIFGSFNTSQPFGTNSGDDHQATNNSNSSNTNNASSTSSLAASEEKLFVFGSVPSSSSTSLSHSPTKTMHRRGINVASKNRNENIDNIFNSLPKPPTFGYQQAVDQKDSTTGDSLSEMSQSLYSILRMAKVKGVTTKISELKSRKEPRKYQIKSYPRDLILEGGMLQVYAFKPLLKIVAPNFCKNVICNEPLLHRLESKEIETLNFFIYMIYSKSSFTNFSLFPSLPFLVFLMDVSKEDFLQQKSYFISQLGFVYLNTKNAVDILVGTDKYIALRNELFTEDISLKFLDQVRITCLEYIGANSSCKEFDYNQDPRVKDYVLEFYRYKHVTRDIVPPFQTPVVIGGINIIYNFKEDSDAVVKIPDSLGGVKTIYCHKTVLSSASEMLEVNFGPNWSNEEDEDGRAIINVEHLIEVASDPSVMEFIIEYAYGIFAPIKVSSKQVIPLIKAAHFYRIQGLLDECLYLCVNRDKLSFFEVAESLEDHFEDETMEAFEDVMVEIGTANYPFIIGASDEELMKLPKRMLIKMFRKIYKTYIPNIKTL